MAIGVQGLHKAQIGIEGVSTAGTEVNATTFWLGPARYVDDSETVFPTWETGYFNGIGGSYVPAQMGTVNLEDTEVTFEQIEYLLKMCVEAGGRAQDGAGSGYVGTYDLPEDTVLTPSTYTWEVGDNHQARIMTGCVGTSLTIKGAPGEALMCSATLSGWPGGDTTFTEGLSHPTVETAVFAKTALYIDDVSGNFGGTQITEEFIGFELTLDNLYKWQMTGEGDSLYPTIIKPGEMEITLTFTLEHNTQSETEYGKWESNTPRLIQLINTGSALSTGGTTYNNKQLIMNLAGSYTKAAEIGFDAGNTVLNFEFKNHYDPTEADRGQIITVNELDSLP